MGKRCFRSLLIPILLLLTLTSNSQNLKRSGQKIVDQNGNEVILRGMGLGGWMLQEPYMMEMSDFASAQWQIKLKIQDLIGPANTVAFYNAWHANHCTKTDIDSLASWGFNSIRLPMHYNLYTLPIEEEPVPGNQTWLEKGFAMTDSLIRWCSANHIYVILDLHAAPGGQGKDFAICDGNPAKASLWESDANKQKTIALWKKLAERYVNEPWVGGYDIINEPNWSFTEGGNQNGCSENTNAPLRQLMINITNAIRTVDSKHIIIIEGNCWGNNYNGVLPPWDENMVLSFHKYWSYNDQGSIQGIMNLRTQHNIPIWLGESGENSNVWFTDAIQLVEKNKIGWAWWPLKKIGSVVNPMTIKKTPEYQTLLDYWKNGGTKPSEGFANYTMMQMASNARIGNCIYRKDVIDAMFRQVYDSATRAFSPHSVPGVIQSTDFDLGRNGKAYLDSEVANYNVSSGTYTAWNSGWSYRNDGVDIEASTDPHPGSNGYDVGWIVDNEWLQYTVTVDSSAAYQIKVRYAGLAGARMRISVNDCDVIPVTSISSSGGYQTWSSQIFDDIILYKGTQKLKVTFEKGGINLGFLGFTISKKISDVPMKAVSAETSEDGESVYITFNKMLVPGTVTSQGFSCTINGQPVTITAMEPSGSSSFQIVLAPGQKIISGDTILISYADGSVKATDGTSLENFANLPVKNNLPPFLAVPGKIEAESFSFNQGFQLETCTDIGGGQNLGYTAAGDYADYRINVKKTALYNLEIRHACLSAAGILNVQQINDNGDVLHSCSINIPVTGGWQTWKSITAEMSLAEGMTKLRVKITKPEFNLNWYRFSEKGLGLNENRSRELKIFPNPAREELTIELPISSGQKKSLLFRNLNGILVKSVELNSTDPSVKVYVGDLPQGFYYLEIDILGVIYRAKLMVQ